MCSEVELDQLASLAFSLHSSHKHVTNKWVIEHEHGSATVIWAFLVVFHKYCNVLPLYVPRWKEHLWKMKMTRGIALLTSVLSIHEFMKNRRAKWIICSEIMTYEHSAVALHLKTITSRPIIILYYACRRHSTLSHSKRVDWSFWISYHYTV